MVVRGPGVPQVLSTVWVVLSGLVWLLGSQKMWLFHWGNAGERFVHQRMMKARQQSHSEQKQSGFCSVQRRYTLVERAEVHSIYPQPEWGNWHSRGGPLYSRWEKKWLCFFKEEFGKSWQNFKPLFSSTCKFIAGNLPFTLICCCCCSVAHVSDSLRPHGLQHARLPCPSLSPRVCTNSGPLHQWCYLTISSSVIPFSSHLQSLPVSGSFPMSWHFT